MAIPYLQRVGIGVHVGEREVRWVELTRTFGRLRLRRYETEPVVGTEREAALARLVERLKPAHRYVVSHVGPDHVRVHFVDAPGFDDPEDLQAWLVAQSVKVLPGGVAPEAFVVRTAVTQYDEEEKARGLIVAAQRAAVEERAAVLERAGLVPLRLATGVVEVASSLAFEEGFDDPERTIIYSGDETAVALRMKEGLLHDAEVLPAADPDVVISELEALGNFARSDAEAVWMTGGSGVVPAGGGRAVTPLHGALRGRTLPSEAAYAAALAAEAVYPGLGYVDLLDPDAAGVAGEQREKGEAQGALVSMGVLILVLLLAATLATVFLGREVAHTEAQVAARAEVLEALQEARARRDRLERDVGTARDLVGQRTAVARVLEDVGRSVPEGVWLTRLSVVTPTEGPAELAVQGLALDNEAVAAYLASLERLAVLGPVEMTYSERVSVEEARRRYAQEWPLVAFGFAAVVRWD